jgi:hypothetical protein
MSVVMCDVLRDRAFVHVFYNVESKNNLFGSNS